MSITDQSSITAQGQEPSTSASTDKLRVTQTRDLNGVQIDMLLQHGLPGMKYVPIYIEITLQCKVTFFEELLDSNIYTNWCGTTSTCQSTLKNIRQHQVHQTLGIMSQLLKKEADNCSNKSDAATTALWSYYAQCWASSFKLDKTYYGLSH